MRNVWLDRKKAKTKLDFIVNSKFYADKFILHYKVEVIYDGKVILPFTVAESIQNINDGICIKFPDTDKFSVKFFGWLAEHNWQGNPAEVMDATIKVYAGRYPVKTQQLKLGFTDFTFGKLDSDKLNMSLNFSVL